METLNHVAMDLARTSADQQSASIEANAINIAGDQDSTSQLQETVKDHALAVENLRQVIVAAYPDTTRSDFPYYNIRNHMAAVLRSLESLQETL